MRADLNRRSNLITSGNDTMSRVFENLVPEKYKDTDKFLNILQWNIEWFGASKSRTKDQKRVSVIIDVLSNFNADLFVFQEIAGPSKDGRYPGALDQVAEELTKMGAGDYVVFYTQAGGEQRVAMMWDRDWVRAKTEVEDLFPVGTHKMDGGVDVFAKRTPLYGYFTSKIESGQREDKFDFQVLGVHLKAMGDGFPQRAESAKILSKWMTDEAWKTDGDVLIMGDFNAPPGDKKSWGAFHELEKENPKKVAFEKINDNSDFSYLWLANRKDKFLSRIDLTVMSLASPVKVKAGDAIRWAPIDEALSRASGLTDKQVVDVMKEIKENVSDHLPTLTQFYLADPPGTRKPKKKRKPR